MLLTGATVYELALPCCRARFGFARTGSRARARRSASFAETEDTAPFCEPDGRWVRVWEEESCEEREGALSWLVDALLVSRPEGIYGKSDEEKPAKDVPNIHHTGIYHSLLVVIRPLQDRPAPLAH